MCHKLKIFALISALIFCSHRADAANVSSGIQSKASLSSSCVVSATNVNFGTVTPANTGSLYTTSKVSLTCSNNLSYRVVLSTGNSAANTDSNGYGLASTLNNTFIRTSNPLFTTNYVGGPARIMNGSISSDYLVFNLFEDSAHTIPFIDANYLTQTGTGANQDIPVYAALPLEQYITPDVYTQTVMVVITF